MDAARSGSVSGADGEEEEEEEERLRFRVGYLEENRLCVVALGATGRLNTGMVYMVLEKGICVGLERQRWRLEETLARL